MMPPMAPRRDIPDDEPDVVDELRHQAEWSSYTQDIPRVGDRRKEEMRLATNRRVYRWVLTPRGFFRSRMWRVSRWFLCGRCRSVTGSRNDPDRDRGPHRRLASCEKFVWHSRQR